MHRDRNLFPLSHSHQRGLGLCVLVQRELASDASPQNIARQAARLLDHYNGEILEHFLIEERYLFPSLSTMPELAPLVRELMAEHAQIANLVANISYSAARETLEQFCQQLSAHIRKEERQLFPRVQDGLSQQQLEQLGEQLLSYDAPRASRKASMAAPRAPAVSPFGMT